MFRWILLLVLIVGLSAAVPLLLANLPADSSRAGLSPGVAKRKGPAGRASVDGSLVHEFGTVAQWTEGEKEWTVKNIGEGDLELAMGSSSCMCTVANFARDESTGEQPNSLVLKPGDSTKIKVTWKTKDSQDEFRKTTSILTSDPRKPQITFEVAGVVQPALMTMPPTGDFGKFGRISNTESKLLPMLVSSVDRPDFKIVEVVTSNPEQLAVRQREANAEELKAAGYARAIRIDVEARPSPVLGNFREEVVVRTDHPERPELKLTVEGSRVGPIMLTEPSLRIYDANTARGGSKSLILTVQGHDRTNFEVISKPARLDVQVRPIEVGDTDSNVRRYTLTATIPPGTTAGTISGEVVLDTDHPDVSRLRIPVSAAVLSATN